MAELLVLDPCHRLSKRNRGITRVFIDNLMNKKKETVTRLLELEELVVDYQATNLELCERLAKLEKVVRTKTPTKTYAERPSKLVPKRKQDLVDFIDSMNEQQSDKCVIIEPLEGGHRPSEIPCPDL